jgi:sugar phosphate isomerase/epimerase
MSVQLANAYWTSAGPVEVHFGREWSLYDFGERCSQAAEAGFVGLGIWHADLEHQLESRSLEDLRRDLDNAGMRCYELEFLWDWFVDDDDRPAADRTRKMLFEAAAALDAHHIKAGNIPGKPCEMARLNEAYGELVADAAQRCPGSTVLYEFMPFDVNVNSIDTALAVMDGIEDTGVVIDTWHMAKLGVQPDDLRRFPVERLGWIELSDGQFENMEDQLDEVVNRRKLPGEGEFPIREYVRVAQDMGYSEVWGVEVLSEDLRALPLDEMYRRTFEAASAQFEPVAA